MSPNRKISLHYDFASDFGDIRKLMFTKFCEISSHKFTLILNVKRVPVISIFIEGPHYMQHAGTFSNTTVIKNIFLFILERYVRDISLNTKNVLSKHMT